MLMSEQEQQAFPVVRAGYQGLARIKIYCIYLDECRLQSMLMSEQEQQVLPVVRAGHLGLLARFIRDCHAAAGRGQQARLEARLILFFRLHGRLH